MATTDEIRLLVGQEGLDGFESGDLQEQDLMSIAWSGDALHIGIMRDQLRASDISADTIAIYAPDGTVVSKGYVVHNPILPHQNPGDSVISQLATQPELQSLGFGTRLMTALEERIVERGNHKAVLGVETNNPRALELYNRLGYQCFKTAVDAWQAVDEAGREYRHQTDVHWLFKAL